MTFNSVGESETYQNTKTASLCRNQEGVMSEIAKLEDSANRIVKGIGMSTYEKDGYHQGLMELVLEILHSINQFTRGSEQTMEQGRQEVIFKKVIQGHCFTLLYSIVDREETNKSVDAMVLSPREHEIVRLTSHGLSNKAIAAVLDISPWTVNTYIRRIFIKLNVNTRAEMVAVAARAGMMENQVENGFRAK
jgi:DNA-binding CsgD family transcriptional regulator